MLYKVVKTDDFFENLPARENLHHKISCHCIKMLMPIVAPPMFALKISGENHAENSVLVWITNW